MKIPYFYYSSDQLVDSGMLPKADRVNDNTEWSWNILRPKFFNGFHKSISAFANAGLYLLVEHIVEYSNWFYQIVTELNPFTVLYIGVMCPIEEIEKREFQRGNRQTGEGRSHIEDGIHTWSEYDLTVDTSLYSPQENAKSIIKYIEGVQNKKSVFEKVFEQIVLKK